MSHDKEAEISSRRRLHWHRSSFILALIATLPLLLLMIPGQQAEYKPTESSRLFQHGWPYVHLERVAPADELQWNEIGPEQMKLLEEFLVDRAHALDWHAPDSPELGERYWTGFSNWNFVAGGSSKLPLGGRAIHGFELAVNTLILLGVYLLLTWVFDKRRRRKNGVFQVSIAEVLILFCLVGVVLTLFRNAATQVRIEAAARAELREGVACFLEQQNKTPNWLARLLDNNRIGRVTVNSPGKAGGSMVLSNSNNPTGNEVPLGMRIVGVSFENSMRFVRDNDAFARHLDSFASLEHIGHWQGNKNSLEILKKIKPDGIRKLDIYSFIDDEEYKFISRFENLESLTLRSVKPEVVFYDQPVFDQLKTIEIDGAPSGFVYEWLNGQPSLDTVVIWTSDAFNRELVDEFKSNLPKVVLQDRFGRSY